MARTLANAKLGSPNARAGLKPRGKPYYSELEPGVHLGYRKPTRGAGKWVLRTYEGNGVYKVEVIATADDLVNARDADGVELLSWKQVHELAREVLERRSKAATRAYSVSDAVAEYLEWFATSRRSIVDTKHRAEIFIIPSLGDRAVADLTADEIRKWHADLAKAPARVRSKAGKPQRFKKVEDPQDPDYQRRRRASANRTLTILKAALNRAWRDKKVATDEAWRRVEPFASVDAARVHYLSIDEARRLINAADPEFRPLVEAALQTGCRYGELCRLTAGDFNADAGTLAIRTSKSGKPRHVVLTDEGIELFRRLCVGRRRGDLLFVSGARVARAQEIAAAAGKESSEDGSWRASQQARPMLDACQRAKISPSVNFHALRHTWASHSVMNGVPLMVVAKNLGHADTKMVEKHYGHLAPSFIVNEIRSKAPKFGAEATSNVTEIRGVNGRQAR